MEDFYDPDMGWAAYRDNGKCLKKEPEDHYYNSSGTKMTNQVLGYRFKISDVSRLWCPRTQGEKFFIIPNKVDALSGISVWQVVSSNVYKVPKQELYSVTLKRGDERFYRLHKTREGARAARTFYSANSYQAELGDIAGQVEAWFDIVLASGTESEKLSAAKHAALLVDINLSLLIKKYPPLKAWNKSELAPLLAGG